MKTLSFTTPLLLAAAMFVLSCAKESIPPPAAFDEPATQQEEQTSGDLYETAAYQEATGDWLLPSHDPYDLIMVQQAYNNLTKGRAVIPRRESLEVTFAGGVQGLQAGLLPEVAKEFEKPARKGFKLKPTHRVLKTWPRTREQAESLEADERLDVRTYPMNYTPISAQEAKKLSKTRMASAYKLPKETKYKYTDPGGESTAGFVPPSEVELPVFYIVWPTDIAVPADLDHEVLYEVFLPEKNTLNLSEKALQTLDFETLELARRADQGLEMTAMATSANHPFTLGESVGDRTLILDGSPIGWQGETVGTDEPIVIFSSGRGAQMNLYYNEEKGLYLGKVPFVGTSHKFPLGLRVTYITPRLKMAAHWQDQEQTATTPPRGGGSFQWDSSLLVDDDPDNQVFLSSYYVNGKALYTLKDPTMTALLSGEKEVPLTRLQVKFTTGSKLHYLTHTDENGTFSTGSTSVPNFATMTLVFDDAERAFKIKKQFSSMPAVSFFADYSLGSVEQNYRNNKYILHPDDNNYPLFETWIAATFFWHGNHPIPANKNINDPVLLMIGSQSNENSHFHTDGDHHIDLFRKPLHIENLGAAFHELGHWAQWCMKGKNDSTLAKVDLRIKESWAAYVGWLLVHKYFKWDESAEKTTYDYDPSGNSWQSWVAKENASNYTPLFVDLLDDYDQSIWLPLPGIPADRVVLAQSYDLLNRLGQSSQNIEDFKRLLWDYYDYYWSAVPSLKTDLSEYLSNY